MENFDLGKAGAEDLAEREAAAHPVAAAVLTGGWSVFFADANAHHAADTYADQLQGTDADKARASAAAAGAEDNGALQEAASQTVSQLGELGGSWTKRILIGGAIVAVVILGFMITIQVQQFRGAARAIRGAS